MRELEIIKRFRKRYFEYEIFYNPKSYFRLNVIE
jgi:hypothetical protein